MARRKERFPLKMIAVSLFADDLTRLAELYPKLTISKIVRELLHQHIRSVNEAAAAAHPAPELPND